MYNIKLVTVDLLTDLCSLGCIVQHLDLLQGEMVLWLLYMYPHCWSIGEIALLQFFEVLNADGAKE